MTTPAPPIRCSACEAVLLGQDEHPLDGQELAAATAMHYALAHDGVQVPVQRLVPRQWRVRDAATG